MNAARRRVDLMGMPTDVHSSFLRGPAKAPPLIRAALFSPHGNSASERGFELGAEINLNDCGDLPLTEMLEDDALIREAIDASLLGGAIPISLGGDHSITYPIIQAIAAHHGPVDILHFDAHPDL
jgi:arginase family enzyme